MLFSFFLLLLRFTYVLGYINGWQSYNTIKFPQGGVNDYRKSLLPSCLETARWDSLRGFLLLPVHGDVSMYFCWESMGERHQLLLRSWTRWGRGEWIRLQNRLQKN